MLKQYYIMNAPVLPFLSLEKNIIKKINKVHTSFIVRNAVLASHGHLIADTVFNRSTYEIALL